MKDYNSFVEDFDKKINRWLIGSQRHNECYRVIKQLDDTLRPETKVLEYGAWPGLYCVYINIVYGSEVWAIDNWQFAKNVVSCDPEKWIQFVEAYGRTQVHAQQGDICNTEFPDKFFDVIYSLGVHEHIPDDLQALREMDRILKDDGLCSMTVDFAGCGWEFLPNLLGRCYDRLSLENLIANSSFTFVRPPDYESLEEITKDNSFKSPNIGALSILLKKRI